MAVDASFASLLDNFMLESPRLPPRPWESIPSEGVFSNRNSSTSRSSCLYDTSTVSEASMVRLAVNALQGGESALASIEKLSTAFCCDPADRTFHRIPSLWNRSSSTVALANVLKSVGHSGCIVFLLRKFVAFFLNFHLDGKFSGKKQMNLEEEENQNGYDNEGAENTPYSLVNQAFAVAVRNVLDGYVSALDMLYASVGLRHMSKTYDVPSCSSSGVGFLTNIGHSETTLLEVYMHTSVLRTQMEALGNICCIQNVALWFSISSFDDLSAKADLAFRSFPKGADLLTFLYTQLKFAEPVHCALLKFLFLRSFEPYCGFIRSWIYEAKINDPYGEFIVDYVDDMLPCSPSNSGIPIHFQLATIRERDGIAVPCFLKDFSIPLFRAGQQLQVLMKLLEFCNDAGSWNHTYLDLLPCWRDWSTSCQLNPSLLTFNKGSMEHMVLERNNYYKGMLEKIELVSTKLKFRCHQVGLHAPVPLDKKSGRSLDDKLQFAVEDNLIFCSSDNRDLNMHVGSMNSEASSSEDEFSSVEDQFESSDHSSLNGSEVPCESENLIELPMLGLEQKYLSALSFSSSFCNDNSLCEPSSSEMSYSMQGKICEICDGEDLLGHDVQPHNKTNVTANSLSRMESWSQTHGTQDANNQNDLDWPSDGIQKNHFHVDRENICDTWLYMSGGRMKVNQRKFIVWEEGMSRSEKALVERDSSKDPESNETSVLSHSSNFCSFWLEFSSNFLSMNPLLAQKSYVYLGRKPEEIWSMKYRKPMFDFTYVEDPCVACAEKLTSTPRHNVRKELSIFTESVTPAAVRSSINCEEIYINDELLIDNGNVSRVNSCLGCNAANRKDSSSENVSGGSGWESLLGSSASIIKNTEYHQTSMVPIPELPLDFVIEKCQLQEILLQYRYVSKLTIKLLEEGFDLQEHLLALRRYHFMEVADWADLFIMSLWRHKWYVKEASKKMSEIQGFLELSVQRSSCERDHNKCRLYVYMKGHGVMPLAAPAIGIHSFDCIGLGYRVDWPVSIILTPSALKIYGDIFNFLVQVKLAVLSLSEVWCSLKGYMHLIDQNRHSGRHELECRFALLMKMRHQVNHFVSTLQQYLQSQLSHVSWCRFMHTLKHKVKDLMDLESVHMEYLIDSLHICFLSDETRTISAIIQNILQCALDFRTYLSGSSWETKTHEGALSNELSQINISQVLVIKATFERSIKELYLCYLKSPKHGEIGLRCLWDYLNYSEYYSEVIDKEMGHTSFLV